MSESFTLDQVRKMEGGGETFTLDDVRAMAGGGNAKPRERTTTLGRASFAGGVPAVAASVAEGMGTPQGRAEALNFLAGGPLRAVTGIGNTILRGKAWLEDQLYDAMNNGRSSEPSPFGTAQRERMALQDQFFAEHFNPASVAFKAGQIGTEVAGTSGVGPVLAAPIRALGGGSRTATALANAIESGGMRTGVRGLNRAADLGVRSAGGAITGGASVALVDPANAEVGAALGASLPVATRGVNLALTGAGQLARTVRPAPGMSGSDVRAARNVASMAGAESLDDIAGLSAALRQQGPRIIPGAQTVPEVVQVPGVSQLQRSVRAVAPDRFVARDAEQELARREVLERIAPVGPFQEVAEQVGSNITGYAIPAERVARQRVSELFDAIPSQEATMHLPLQRMQDAQTRFVGPGSFGKGEASVEQAIRTATDVGMDQATLSPRVVPFNQIQALRSSIGEAITEARMYGRNQAAAALTQMKNAIDDKVAEVAAGTRQPGEVFTPQAIDTWGQALREHALKKSQFNTGPQAGLFRQGGDGLPLAQGAEVPRRFFNANASQVSDAQSFRRLVRDDPRLMADLRSYAVSDAARQTDRFGNLTSAKFNRWLDAREGATGEVFTEQQRTWLRAIADDLRRADLAESIGRSTGSDTAQKAASMMRLGLVDNSAGRWLAGRLPGGNTALDYIAGPARQARADRLSELLLDPALTADLLDVYVRSQRSRPSGLPGVGAGDPLLYRSAPLLLTGPSR